LRLCVTSLLFVLNPPQRKLFGLFCNHTILPPKPVRPLTLFIICCFTGSVIRSV
jgi:hypothetical protein